jgi:hypothetical protein
VPCEVDGGSPRCRRQLIASAVEAGNQYLLSWARLEGGCVIEQKAPAALARSISPRTTLLAACGRAEDAAAALDELLDAGFINVEQEVEGGRTVLVVDGAPGGSCASDPRRARWRRVRSAQLNPRNVTFIDVGTRTETYLNSGERLRSPRQRWTRNADQRLLESAQQISQLRGQPDERCRAPRRARGPPDPGTRSPRRRVWTLILTDVALLRLKPRVTRSDVAEHAVSTSYMRTQAIKP